jgi:hypothetical protein
MPGRSKGRGHAECNPKSFRLGVGHGADYPTPEKIHCYETMEEAKTNAAPVKKKRKVCCHSVQNLLSN